MILGDGLGFPDRWLGVLRAIVGDTSLQAYCILVVPGASTAIDFIVTAGEVGDFMPSFWDRRTIASVTSGDFFSDTSLLLERVSKAC